MTISNGDYPRLAVWASPLSNAGAASFLASLAAAWVNRTNRRIVAVDPGAGWVAPFRSIFHFINNPAASVRDGKAGTVPAVPVHTLRRPDATPLQADPCDGLLVLSVESDFVEIASRLSFQRIGIAFSRRLPALCSAEAMREKLAAVGWPTGRLIPLLMEDRGPGLIPLNAVEEKWGSALRRFYLPAGSAAESELTGRPLKDSSQLGALLEALSSDIEWTDPSLGAHAMRSIEKEVYEKLQSRWSKSSIPVTEPVMKEEAAKECTACLESSGRTNVSPGDRNDLLRRIWNRLKGLGPLEPLFGDPRISEIMVHQGERVFVERNGRIREEPAFRLEKDDVRFVVEKLLSYSGRRADQAQPMADVRLADGSRANIVLPPVAVDGPVITIRRFRSSVLVLEDLLRHGSATEAQLNVLVRLVERRKNLLLAGNTGAGKTTLLNILANHIDSDERIITLEDTAELRLKKPHVVRLETRTKNLEGEGAITMKDLVINALRMRPDRMIVGECRGDEVIPMLQAMNTGHTGSMTTLHANSADDAVKRLESMVLIGAPSWPLDVVRSQIGAGFDAVVFLRRHEGRRRIEEISALGCANGAVRLEPIS